MNEALLEPSSSARNESGGRESASALLLTPATTPKPGPLRLLPPEKALRLADRPGARLGVRGWLKEMLYAAYLGAGPRYLRTVVRRWEGEPQICILYYHRIGACDYLTKPTIRFQQDLTYLARHFDCLTLRELCERMDAGRPFTRPVAVVTFDDGYRDNYTLAFPLLKLLGVPATFFVTTGYMDTQRVFPHDERAEHAGLAMRSDWPKLCWDDLREMQAAGMEIGSHTVGHVNMSKCSGDRAREEAQQSLADLQRELGHRPRAFCFPWGRPEDISQDAVDAVRSVGYYAAVTTTPGEVSHRSARFRLPRIDVGNGHMSPLAVAARLQGFGGGRLARCLHRAY